MTKKPLLDADDLALLERIAGILLLVMGGALAIVMVAAVAGVAIRVFLAASGIGGN